MHNYIPRLIEAELRQSLAVNPVTAVLGPRQAGKSTLVWHCLAGRKEALILDLDLPSDLRRLSDPELFLREHADRLVCIDEVQLKPDLFPLMRALVDLDRRPGRFVILGSASRDLIRQSSETLAGRIHYLELTPFRFAEIEHVRGYGPKAYRTLWWRGGFPPAFLEASDAVSSRWRLDLVRTFLSRDIPQFGFHISAMAMERFWKMLAHVHGSVLNASKLGQALDVTHVTVRKYLDILEQTFMVRVLRPFEGNLKKRLVKSPKVYIRDSGILHTLLEIDTATDLFGHPVFGASWEGWCIEQIVHALPEWRASFFRTATGEEVDLILERGKRRLAFEFKASAAPQVTKGFFSVLDMLKPVHTWVVCPMDGEGYSLRDNVKVAGIGEMLREVQREGSRMPS
jgi:predicted AAA+ superfamily ATPase